VQDPTDSPLLEGRWRLLFTTRPGSASPIQKTFVGVDAFTVYQEVLLTSAERARVNNVVDFGAKVGTLKASWLTRPALFYDCATLTCHVTVTHWVTQGSNFATSSQHPIHWHLAIACCNHLWLNQVTAHCCSEQKQVCHYSVLEPCHAPVIQHRTSCNQHVRASLHDP